jgi:hypothetical protein
MVTLSISITGLALTAALAVAALLAPIDARAGDATTDCHEIPTFVLQRTEIATGAEASTRVAASATAP